MSGSEGAVGTVDGAERKFTPVEDGPTVKNKPRHVRHDSFNHHKTRKRYREIELVF